jgi:hypothetical protein
LYLTDSDRSAEAQFLKGTLIAGGIGAPRDPLVAFDLIQRAAEQVRPPRPWAGHEAVV